MFVLQNITQHNQNLLTNLGKYHPQLSKIQHTITQIISLGQQNQISYG